MKHKTVSVLLGLPAAFLLGSLMRPDALRSAADLAHPPINDISPVVAVVDIGRVLKGYPRVRELDEAWKAEADQLELGLRKMKEDLDKLKLEMNGWDTLSPQWIEAGEKVEAVRAAAESRSEMQKRRLMFERLKNRELIYDDIDRAVEELAKKLKLQLVLKMLPDMDGETVDNRVQMWAAKSVFYYDAKLDLTESVIKSLKSPAFAGGAPASAENGK